MKKEYYENITRGLFLHDNWLKVLYFLVNCYKIKEIAKLMKTKEGTVKTWAFRAREILKQKLEGGF